MSLSVDLGRSWTALAGISVEGTAERLRPDDDRDLGDALASQELERVDHGLVPRAAVRSASRISAAPK